MNFFIHELWVHELLESSWTVFMKFMNFYSSWIGPFVVHAHSWTCSWTYSWTIHELFMKFSLGIYLVVHELFINLVNLLFMNLFMNSVHELIHELSSWICPICCSWVYSWIVHELRSWTIHHILDRVHIVICSFIHKYKDFIGERNTPILITL